MSAKSSQLLLGYPLFMPLTLCSFLPRFPRGARPAAVIPLQTYMLESLNVCQISTGHEIKLNYLFFSSHMLQWQVTEVYVERLRIVNTSSLVPDTTNMEYIV